MLYIWGFYRDLSIWTIKYSIFHIRIEDALTQSTPPEQSVLPLVTNIALILLTYLIL